MALELSDRLQIDYVERHKESVGKLMDKYGVEAVLVAYPQELKLNSSAGEMFFHPNMSQLRVKNLRKGEKDHMSEAMGLQEGMKVLDCTLGFGADAIVASFGVGETGQVVGVESSPLIAAVTGHGLQHFLPGNYPLYAAMRRIEVINMDYLDFLRQQPDNSYDVVYFDPMFRKPLTASNGISPLRSVANHEPLSLEAVKEAQRVARYRVVMKEASGSEEFSRLGFSTIMWREWINTSFLEVNYVSREFELGGIGYRCDCQSDGRCLGENGTAALCCSQSYP